MDIILTKYHNQYDYFHSLRKMYLDLFNYYIKTLDLDIYNLDFVSYNSEALQNSELVQLRADARRIYFQTKENIERIKKNDYNKDKRFVFDDICERFGIVDEEYICFALSVLFSDNSTGTSSIFSAINQNSSEKYPTFDLAIRLFDMISETVNDENLFIRKKLLSEKMNFLFFKNSFSKLELNEAVFDYIMSDGKFFGKYDGVSVYKAKKSKPLIIMDNIALNIAELLKNKFNSTAFIYIHGKKGSGKKSQIKRVIELTSGYGIFIDLSAFDLEDMEAIESKLLNICQIALIKRASICLLDIELLHINDNDDIVTKTNKQRKIKIILDKLSLYTNTVFITSEDDYFDHPYTNNKYWFDFKITSPSIEESKTLWSYYIDKMHLKERVDVTGIVNKFDYTPEQISKTYTDMEKEYLLRKKNDLNTDDLYSCIRRQTSNKLLGKATLLEAKFNWDSIVLPDAEKEMLLNACNQVNHRDIVYDKWGMSKKISYGTGVNMLFEGPPGTGKTMGAHVIANALGIDIYKVNMSKVVSKYIGETEKNLDELFDVAKDANVILLFDEADAILGKRTSVKDSHDKNANLETSFLLQKMEEYKGITIMTTNHIENIDSAFYRRINYIVNFPFPSAEYRKQIWLKTFSDSMPISEDVDFDYLSKKFELAGGNIKNIVLASAFFACKDEMCVEMKHILKAVIYELKKQGKGISIDDFGEYKYLIKKY